MGLMGLYVKGMAMSEAVEFGYKVRQGGLMRCCLHSIQEAMSRATEPPNEGDTLTCAYGGASHAEDGKMRFRDGAWEWNQPAGPHR